MSKLQIKERLRKSLKDDFLRMATRRATDSLRHKKLKAANELGDWETWREAAEKTRTHIIGNLDYYLNQLIENVEKNGGHVHLAKGPRDAVEIVRQIAKKHNAEMIIKSKSMVSEEIHLNKALEGDGIEVVESDLGEYIIQIAGEPPSHIIVPAMHKTREQIKDLFQPLSDSPLTSDTPTLTAFARKKLREKFLKSAIGITGCNFAIANTGSIAMVTNEGNGRMVSTLPKVQIAFMGMERIVPSIKELGLFLNLLPRSATGQTLTAYTTIITPPRRDEDADGPEEFHLIILDHNRSEILGDETFHPALRCIRCGACFNVCPVYRQIGGHAYGSVYAGPIGVVITPLLEKDWEKWGHLPMYSSLCGACSEACPVRIPLHELIVKLRDRKVNEYPSDFERRVFRAYRWYFTHPRVLRKVLVWGSYAQKPFMRNGRVTMGPPPLANWVRSRTLPPVARPSFYDRWPQIQKEYFTQNKKRGE